MSDDPFREIEKILKGILEISEIWNIHHQTINKQCLNDEEHKKQYSHELEKTTRAVEAKISNIRSEMAFLHMDLMTFGRDLGRNM